MARGISAFEWRLPPEDRVGGIVPLETEVAASGDVVIAVTHLTAHPQGFCFDFVVLTRGGPGEAFDEESEDISLRFGVEFADGRAAETRTNWFSREGEGGERPVIPDRLPPDPARDIFINGTGGGSLSRRYFGTFWVWPLPPPGPLTLTAGWPAAGLPVAPTRIDAAAVLDAATASRPLWEDG
jgi:hypothetical protein